MNIQIQNGTVTFDEVIVQPTNHQLLYYIEKVDPYLLHFELSGSILSYPISSVTLNNITYDVAEGLIINYYNLLNENI